MSNSIPDMIREYLANGDPTGWFEEVYATAEANDSQPPWADMKADQGFVAWVQKTGLSGDGRSAVVIGCGLGDDAQYLAQLGFAVTAFDVSPTAIEICQKRFPDSTVTYQQADLFNLPPAWQGGFDFVCENRTIQALPVTMEIQSKTAVANLVGDGGQLLILCHGREEDDPKQGIPWALSRDDLAFFSEQGLQQQAFETYHDGRFRRFLALYQR